MVKYRLYPSLLDEFSRFERGAVSEENLLNRINRVRDFDDETFRRMQRGIRFEKAVLKNTAGEFGASVISEVRSRLPSEFTAQFPATFIHEDVYFYGFADIVGNKRIIDLKTTAKFNEQKYALSFQNLYLYALKDKGARTMEYIVYDFEQIHHLIYTIEGIDFKSFLLKIEDFKAFLDEHKRKITDPKILVKKEGGWLF